MNYITNYSKNLTTILTIFSINLYTLEDKSMNQRATEYDLNDSQLEQLIDKYIETIVDSMSMEDLQYYVTNNMAEFMHELTFSGILEEIKYTLDDEMLDEFVTEIKSNSKD